VSGKNVDLGADWEPHKWYYEKDLGFSDDEVHQAWELLKQPEHPFLYDQPDLPWTLACVSRLNSMSMRGADVYFITSRVGPKAKYWTEIWLAERGMDYPTVLISRAEEKWALCRNLHIDAALEDKPDTLMRIQEACPSAKLGLVPWRYNRLDQEAIADGIWTGVEVVNNIPAWLDSLMPLPDGVSEAHPEAS
jgi:hypothetical protein